MKKTNFAFSRSSKKSAWLRRALGMSLLFAFLFVGMSDASAQKPESDLEVVQMELDQLNQDLSTIDAELLNHPKVAYYNQYATYLAAVIADMEEGMSMGAAKRANIDLYPQTATTLGAKGGNDDISSSKQANAPTTQQRISLTKVQKAGNNQ